MNDTIISVIESLIGPAIPVGLQLSRREALQPTPDTRGNLDFDRFLSYR